MLDNNKGEHAVRDLGNSEDTGGRRDIPLWHCEYYVFYFWKRLDCAYSVRYARRWELNHIVRLRICKAPDLQGSRGEVGVLSLQSSCHPKKGATAEPQDNTINSSKRNCRYDSGSGSGDTYLSDFLWHVLTVRFAHLIDSGVI